MDTSKLITVTVWATIAFIAYEVYKAYYGGGANDQLGNAGTGLSNAQALSALESGVKDVSSEFGPTNQLALPGSTVATPSEDLTGLGDDGF